MEPRIQYAKTKDGVSIAFWTLGEGMPLVHMPTTGISHTQLEWQFPEYRRWYERLAEKRMLVRYDSRGAGLSDRDVTDYSLDAHMLDLEAVADRLGLAAFVLLAPFDAGPVAITYTARHPQRVSHLVLWCSHARASDYFRSPRGQALSALREQDWELYTETLAHVLFGWSEGEEAHRFAAYVRECVTPDALQAARSEILKFDATPLLSQVKSPTLVLHRRQAALPDVGVARGLASSIPDARLALLEGMALAPFLGDMDAVLSAIDEFLGEGAEEAEARTELPEGMAVILFADIVESTALTEQMGDTAFRAKARELDTALRSVIRECAGTPVEGKVLGDGVLAVFTSARQAIECALRCNAASEPAGLQLHLGIHAGDVIREGDNIYGGAVNIAARIATASAPGEVLVSDTVRGLARTSAGVMFDDRGEHSLKGIEEPQRLFAVRGGG
ncbi:MAG: adenylate/guanylate cyclase domain-containing protein [Dehalococcoidia bacterium]